MWLRKIRAMEKRTVPKKTMTAAIPKKIGKRALRWGGRVPQDCSCAIRLIAVDSVDGAAGQGAEQPFQGTV